MKNNINKILSFSANNYEWRYCSVGGVMRVKIETGEDIAHLKELDQKMWTVLSCPTKGLEFPEKTLGFLDSDNDGKIRVNEIVAASEWLCNVLKNPDYILKGADNIPFDEFNDDSEEGHKLKVTAQQILSTLGLEKDAISIADVSDSMAIFSKTRFNGDGVITLASTEDEDLKKIIQSIMDVIGKCADRSGEDGVNAEQIEQFYAGLTDFIAWKNAANKDNYPYGDNTEAALAACEVIKDKVADFFMRCKFVVFDEDCTNALDVSVDKVSAISNNNLATCSEEIASYPLARPRKDCMLPITEGINPAWEAAFNAVKNLVLDVDFAGRDSISESEWNSILAKFASYNDWKASKKGEVVESIDLEYLKLIETGNRKADLLALIDQDLSVAGEVEAISSVEKLLYITRDFYKLLKNYVIFSDFYNRNPGFEAIFQVGQLYIDQRCCDLCIRVDDMSKHADMAGMSGMYLLYCNCVSKTKNKTMDIVAVLTEGNVDNLRVGKNAIFYDRDGCDWDAVVTKIVDNPISIKQAFWSPYRKFWNWVTEKINKSASEKESSSFDKMTANAQSKLDQTKADLAAAKDNPDVVPEKKTAPAFDIAKFAGIFAAIGMAVGFIADALLGLAKGISEHWYNLPLLIIGVILIISGPSMFIAWSKLRKRNLGPVLNANGWAINSQILVNASFGATLTSLANYPKFDLKTMKDPFVNKETPKWKKWLIAIAIILVVAFAALFFTDNLKFIGLPFHKEQPAVVEEEPISVEEVVADSEDAVEVVPETV